MLDHTFAVCAYKDSPYLEECIRSLMQQSVPARVIVCTSTPSHYIDAVAKKYALPVFVREGKSDIQDDWNFAYEKAGTRLVTIAHQDDCYHKDYAKEVERCWKKYPDTTVFTSDCAIVKHGEVQKRGVVQAVKVLLRVPLRLHRWADCAWVKKAALMFGNPIICPSCTYNREMLGERLFHSEFKFALDWDTMWDLAEKKGRFICVERPLIRYRIHEGATTKVCIVDDRRYREETAMFEKIWPKPMVKLLMLFYQKAYSAYN